MKSRKFCPAWLGAAMTAVALASTGVNETAPALAETDRLLQVSDGRELDAALKEARPGDTLVMTNGVWKDVHLRFRGTGKPDAPITLRAQTPGKVILTGSSRLSIIGRHLVVDGLLFKDETPTDQKSSPVISFRGDGKHSHHCRVTSCAVVDFSPPDKTRDTRWVSLYGTHHRLDHCHFANKTNLGTTVVVWLNDPPQHEPNHHRIDHNRFWTRPTLGMNGGETIRVGDSPRSMLNSRTVVEDNYFYRCNGEGEIISNKSCENVYRANTFVQCEGALTLRHGNRCTVDGNFFLGDGARLTGGVRVIGEDHKITNNYFSGLAGDDYRAALTMMEGIRDSELGGYFQVKRALVASNTFLDNRQTFNLGFATGRPGQVMPPLDCVLSNNVVLGGRSPLITIHDPGTTVTFTDNVIYGAELGIPAVAGIRELDPKLAKADDGIWRPTRSSPVFDADRPSDGPSPKSPLKPEQVGPRWLELGP